MCEILPDTEKIDLMITERKRINNVQRKDVKFKDPAFGWKQVNNINPDDFEEIENKCKQMEGKQGSDLARIRFRRKFVVDSDKKIKRKLKEAWNEIKSLHAFLEKHCG